MRHAISLTLLGAGVFLMSCTGPVILGTGAAIGYPSRPAQPDAADVGNSIPPHESWCYRTVGEAECYAHAQNVPPGRLINVDPPNRYPLTRAAYRDALNPQPPPVMVLTDPIPLQPPTDIRVERQTLSDEVNSEPPQPMMYGPTP